MNQFFSLIFSLSYVWFQGNIKEIKECLVGCIMENIKKINYN